MKIYKPKIAVTSDIHLGVHVASPKWHKITLEVAEWIRNVLIEHNITDLIILGDVLHNRYEVSVTTLHVLPKFFNTLNEFNVIIPVGNHDCHFNTRTDVNSVATLKEWDNITILDEITTINAFDNKLTFYPWNLSLKQLETSDIIFGHFEINTFEMSRKRLCNTGINVDDLINAAKLVLSGHFHNTQIRNYNDCTIVYTGSPYEQSWGEANHSKGIYLIDIETKEYEFIENTTSPKHKRIKLSEMLTEDGITEEIKNDFRGNIVKFIIDTEISYPVLDKLTKKLAALKPVELSTEKELVYSEAVRDEVKKINLDDAVDIQNGIIEFVDLLEIDNNDKVTKYLLDVYNRVEKKSQGEL
jgi:DNA repair exonuclease SbcCD nuclease subunit